MSETTTPGTPPAGTPPPATDAPKAEGAEAAVDKKKLAGQKAAAAAKAGLQAFKNVGQGAALKARGTLIAIVSAPLLLFKGDLLTRILMVGFLASIALLALTTARLWERFVPVSVKQAQTETGQGMSKFLQAQKDLAIATASVVFLERFSSTLRSESGKVKVFELEVYVETDGPETSAALKGHLEEVRELVSTAIQGQQYERLMTDEGKAEFKKQIGEAIERGLHKKWQSEGHIRRVFFTRFVMG